MYIYFGHHRCATQWTNAVMQSVCQELGWKFGSEAQYGKVPALQGVDFFSHVNADRRIVAQLEGTDYRAFHVIRDPRDVLVSSYFSDKFSHHVYSDDFAKFRALLNSLSFREGMLLELDHRTTEYEVMRAWDFRNPRIYETRYETLTSNPVEEFRRIFRYLEVPVTDRFPASLIASLDLLSHKALSRVGLPGAASAMPEWWFHRILRRYSFQRISGREKGEEDQHSHYRRGVHGDWRNYMTEDIKACFKQKWGQLLIDLGYETDFNW